MAIEVDAMDVIRYTSFLLNGFVIIYALKQRVLLKSYLAGRWEGVLAPTGNPSTVYHCVLHMASREKSDNTGLLYYFRKDLGSGNTLVQGLDELVEYNDATTSLQKKWNPRFMRVIHKEAPSIAGNTADTTVLTNAYWWDCTIKSIFFSAKMHVEIAVEGQDIKFSGILRKV